MAKRKDIEMKLEKPISPKYNSSKKYIGRELSWLEFNKRVLYQCIRKDVPLMERFNFLNITSSNLDEFIMVRLASVRNSIDDSPKEANIAGMKPKEEYDIILESLTKFQNLQWRCFELLMEELKSTGCEIYRAKDVKSKLKKRLEKVFFEKIYPILIPRNFDTTKEYPEFSSKQLTIAVLLEDDDMQVMSFIPLDNRLPKIFKIPNKDAYITLEEVIYMFLDKIYYKKHIVDYGMIKILREADIELDHNQDRFITERMRDTLLKRRFSTPIFMEATKNISDGFLKLLGKIFGLKKSHIRRSEGVIDFEPYSRILPDSTKYRYKPFKPQFPSELLGDKNIFEAIQSKDILLHHPYESYEPIIRFLEQASQDKHVISIRQTLYRVSSSDSRIVDALCDAARNGKSVSVVLEIKARFDEEKNISLIEKLKDSGVQLIYGVESLKTHCKFIVITRQENHKLSIYTHVGTGNYNEKTASIYTDISYFTNNFSIGQEVTTLFNMISGFSEPIECKRIFTSPHNLRNEITKGIYNEMRNAIKGKQALCIFKVNSISDQEIIDAIYKASSKGVRFIIICRGICSIKRVNSNIEVHSIVGRFLEHSRIYYFMNSGSGNVYISSADLLTRNLDKRYELLIQLTDTASRQKIQAMLGMYLRDTFNRFTMNKDSVFIKVKPDKNNTNVHEMFMTEALEKYRLKSIPKLFK